MTNLHKIRARIRSVNSTQQITRTMKMIAVSKLRKTQTSLAGVRLFADKSQAVLNALLAGDASFEHPYLTPRRHVGRVCYVVFWGNRGLCGAYNQLLLRHLEGLVRAEARPCSVIVCGRWGRDVLAGTDLPVRQIFSDLSDTPTMAEALEIAEELKNLYRTGEADEIHLGPLRSVICQSFIGKPCAASRQGSIRSLSVRCARSRHSNRFPVISLDQI